MSVLFNIKLLSLFWAISFLIHFLWEMLQVPFYQNMAESSHAQVIWTCTQATFGDANIALIAYLVAALTVRSLAWLYPVSCKALLVYLLVGLLITVFFEYLATEVLDRWTYSAQMPTLPLIGTGLLPILQWLIVPLLSLGMTQLLYLGLRHKDRQ